MDKHKYQDLTHRAYTLRGMIINEAIFLERMIDGYLADYFCKDDTTNKELKLLLLSTDRIVFESKRAIFQQLINTHNKEFAKKHPTIFSDIQYIIEQRNFVAHHILDTSTEGIELIDKNSFRLLKYKNSVENILFDPQRVEKVIQLIKGSITAMFELVKDESGTHLFRLSHGKAG